MTITIRLEDQIAKALEAEARARGLSLEQFLQQLAAQTSQTNARTDGNGSANSANVASDFDAAMDELFAKDSRVLPPISSTYRRDEIYADHD